MNSIINPFFENKIESWTISKNNDVIMTNKPKVKPSLSDRKARFEKARDELELKLIEKISTAFYANTAAELIEVYQWTPVQCKVFLDAITARVANVLTLTEAHRQAREMKNV